MSNEYKGVSSEIIDLDGQPKVKFTLPDGRTVIKDLKTVLEDSEVLEERESVIKTVSSLDKNKKALRKEKGFTVVENTFKKSPLIVLKNYVISKIIDEVVSFIKEVFDKYDWF